MFKVKIIHKGLTLIAVPLFFGIAFVLLLSCRLSDANQKFQHELLLKDALITVDVIARRIYSVSVCTVSYFAGKDTSCEKSYSANMLAVAASFSYLQKLLESEPSLQHDWRRSNRKFWQ